MQTKERILKDIREVNADTSGELSPLRYKLAGNFSVEDVKKEFGNWENALKEAGLSVRDKIINDIQETASETTGNLSWDKYAEESGKYSLGDIRDNFGSWGNAKQEAGLRRDAGKISDKELEEDMKRVQKEIKGPVTLRKYDKHGKFSSGVFNLRDYTFAEFRDKIGLESPEPGNPSNEALEAWADELRSVRGRLSVDELRDKLSDTGYSYHKMDINALKEHLEKEGFQFNISSGGSGSKYYVKGPKADSIRQHHQKYLKKIPDDKEDWFMKMSGSGPSPKSIVAGIRYLTEDKTQEEIADEENVSEVSLRNTKQKIEDRFDLNDESIQEISTENNRDKDDSKEQTEEAGKSNNKTNLTDYDIQNYMTNEEQMEELTNLVGVLVKLELDKNLESPEKEKKKARYLKDSGLSNQQIADLLNKEKSTISGQLSRLKSLD
jgi:DNA-binding CsgD family transcriptional regulator